VNPQSTRPDERSKIGVHVGVERDGAPERHEREEHAAVAAAQIENRRSRPRQVRKHAAQQLDGALTFLETGSGKGGVRLFGAPGGVESPLEQGSQLGAPPPDAWAFFGKLHLPSLMGREWHVS
jgi:hypothetical protein